MRWYVNASAVRKREKEREGGREGKRQRERQWIRKGSGLD